MSRGHSVALSFVVGVLAFAGVNGTAHADPSSVTAGDAAALATDLSTATDAGIDTITLSASIPDATDLTVESGATVTLDLNGYDLATIGDDGDGGACTSADAGLTLGAGTTFTITDTSGGTPGTISATGGNDVATEVICGAGGAGIDTTGATLAVAGAVHVRAVGGNVISTGDSFVVGGGGGAGIGGNGSHNANNVDAGTVTITDAASVTATGGNVTATDGGSVYGGGAGAGIGGGGVHNGIGGVGGSVTIEGAASVVATGGGESVSGGGAVGGGGAAAGIGGGASQNNDGGPGGTLTVDGTDAHVDATAGTSTPFATEAANIGGGGSGNGNAQGTASSLTLPTPTVTQVAPDTGAFSGGTTITVTGTGFVGQGFVTGVTVGGVAATDVTVVDNNTITAVTPAGSVADAGQDVEVVNLASAVGVGHDAFDYDPVVYVDTWADLQNAIANAATWGVTNIYVSAAMTAASDLTIPSGVYVSVQGVTLTVAPGVSVSGDVGALSVTNGGSVANGGAIAPGVLDVASDGTVTGHNYLVSYDPAGGSAIASSVRIYTTTLAGSGFIQLPNPGSRALYSFAGWTVGGAAFTTSTPISADTTVTAMWTLIPVDTPPPGTGSTSDTPSSGTGSTSQTPLTQLAAKLKSLTTRTPIITGVAKVGKTLTAMHGTWKPHGVRFTYKWFANGRRIAGAWHARLKLTTGLSGKRISVKVTGTRRGFAPTTRASRATKPVARAATPRKRAVRR